MGMGAMMGISGWMLRMMIKGRKSEEGQGRARNSNEPCFCICYIYYGNNNKIIDRMKLDEMHSKLVKHYQQARNQKNKKSIQI